MRRFLCYLRLFIVLKTATVVVSLDQADFSAKLGKVADNVLGAKQFEVISLVVFRSISLLLLLLLLLMLYYYYQAIRHVARVRSLGAAEI